MRAWVVVVAVVACKSGKETQPAVTPPPVAAPADASQLADAAVSRPDAAAVADAGLPPFDPEKVLETEVIGPLKLDMPAETVTKALGAPASKTRPVEEGATGEWVSDWSWPGIRLVMGSDTKAGPARIRAIEVRAPSTFTTTRGISVGTSLSQLQRTYPRNTEEGGDPNEYLVGSVYGGLLFTIDRKRVVQIYLGAMAF